MYSRLTHLITAIALCFSFSKAYSQTDSTHYDLGRIRLDKKFTQTITVKAADLQRQPFSSLSEAINVWFYGTYTSSNNMVYVIDGNLANDVNVYNINDIEEITLVQNSAIQVNGAAPLQQLVLIKTKRNRPGKSGIEAAGQTNLVTIRNSANAPALKSTTNLYHQYYLSAYKNTETVNAGVSATYLRDVMPLLKTTATNVSSPLSFDRFKFNGYADAKLGSSNTLSATVNYVPQVSRLKYINNNLPADYNNPNYQTQTNVNDHSNQYLFNGNVQLISQIAKGLTNKLSASYNHYSYKQRYVFNNQSFGGDNYYTSNYLDSNTRITKVFLVQDNLSYRKTSGDFTFEPSVNFSYRYTSDSLAYAGYQTGYAGPNPPDLNDQPAYASYTEHTNYKRKDYLLLPSLSISYKNIFNIQGGFLAALNSKKSLYLQDTTKLKRIFPFASASVDISALAGINALGIKVYASYAKQNMLSQAQNTQLVDLDIINPNTFISQPVFGNNIITANSGYSYSSLKAFNNYTAGTDISINKVVSVNYNFERGYLQIPFIYYQSVPGNAVSYIVFVDSKYTSNRIGLNFNIINKGSTRFISGINTNNISIKTVAQSNQVALGNKIWTGGWVNRLEVDNIFAGLDVLYEKSKGNTIYANLAPYTAVNSQNANSFSLQNVYFGYRLKTNQFKNLEIFANGRNVWQNKKSIITDNRRFYGLGFKLGL